jgi:amidohydrolase
MVSVREFDDQLQQLIAWRRDFHAHPELAFEVERTAGLVAERLSEMGVDEVVTGVGRTGVVAVIHGRTNTTGRVIGLRADMDALPMRDETGLPYASTIDGRFHGCGHDGHTTMLLGAARHLARTRDFDGNVVAIFQPAEEAEGGGLAMVRDGVMDRFGIQTVFALHNSPGVPLGQFETRPGGIMGSADLFEVTITGKGCHAAFPHEGIDPAIAIAQIIQGFQTIVSRNVASSDQHVVSITQIHMGTADNVIAETAKIRGTVRSLSREARQLGKARMVEICRGAAELSGARVDLDYIDDLPVTHNDPEQTEVALKAAAGIVESVAVLDNRTPSMGGEDFSYMLEARPGAFIFLVNGDTAPVHNPKYDFNDAAIPYGCAYFVSLVQNELGPDR